MKNFLMVLSVLALNASLVPTVSFADDAPSPAMDTAKRKVKKAGNRVKEAVCAEGDVKCAAQKVKDRAQEGGDYMKDKTKENVK